MTGYIDERGVYRRGERDMPLPHDVSSQYKDWSHDDQRRRMNADILQPYVNGKPNREFIEVYRGEVASKYFSQEQIDQTERRLGGI